MHRAIKLRGSAKTRDPRLDRVLCFDVRNFGYAIKDIVLAGKEIVSNAWRCRDHLNQGNEGACVGFGVTHELIARPVEVKSLTAKFAREKIYWEAQRLDPWDGGSYPGAKPQYEGTSVLAGLQAGRKLGYFDEYRWAFGIQELLLGLAHEGPAILGINWYEGMSEADRGGYIAPTGGLLGGHCILAKAVNVHEEYVTLHNSWGTRWGDKGDCRITFSDLSRLLREDGEAAFCVRRHAQPKPKK